MTKTRDVADVLAAIEAKGGFEAAINDLVARGKIDPVSAYVMQRLFEAGFNRRFDNAKALQAITRHIGEFEGLVADAQGQSLTDGPLAERFKAFFDKVILPAVTNEEVSMAELQDQYARYEAKKLRARASGVLDTDVPPEIMRMPAKEIAAASDAIYRLAQYNPDPNDSTIQRDRNLLIQKAMQFNGIAIGKQHGPKSGLDKRHEGTRQAKAFVLKAWEDSAHEYDSKADFSRVMAGRVKKQFDVVISAARISEVWLDGKKHPGKNRPR